MWWTSFFALSALEQLATSTYRTVLVHASSLEVVYKLAMMLFVILKPHPLFVESSTVKICHSGQKLQHQQSSPFSFSSPFLRAWGRGYYVVGNIEQAMN